MFECGLPSEKNLAKYRSIVYMTDGCSSETDQKDPGKIKTRGQETRGKNLETSIRSNTSIDSCFKLRN